MQKEIIDFINSQRICVLAIEMLDGSPHASTVHFALDDKSSWWRYTDWTGKDGKVIITSEDK